MKTERRMSLTLAMLATAGLVVPLAALAVPPPRGGSAPQSVGPGSPGAQGPSSPQPISVQAGPPSPTLAVPASPAPQPPPPAPVASTSLAPASSGGNARSGSDANPKPVPEGKGLTATEGGRFLLPGAGSLVIYVRKDIPTTHAGFPKVAPFTLKPANDVFARDGQKYARYEIDCKGVKDCLHTSEELLHGQQFLNDGTTLRSKVASTGSAFGGSDRANKDAARKAKREHPDEVGASANPQVGQAYAIVRLTPSPAGQIESPYHAATVVARDGAHTVTLELLAGQRNAKARTARPQFYVQQVGSETESFHGQMKDAFGADAITLVLQKK